RGSPLPIPNREVKPASADGTGIKPGRVSRCQSFILEMPRAGNCTRHFLFLRPSATGSVTRAENHLFPPDSDQAGRVSRWLSGRCQSLITAPAVLQGLFCFSHSKLQTCNFHLPDVCYSPEIAHFYTAFVYSALNSKNYCVKKAALLITICVIALCTAGYYLYEYFLNRSSITSWDLIPENTVAVYEPGDCQQCLEPVKNSPVWE